MKTGTYISGAGHFLLICWALFGGVFKSEPLPIDTATDVSLISPEDFAQLGGDDFHVLPLSIDRAGLGPVQRFYDEIGIRHLGQYLAEDIRAMLAFAVIGLPTTLLIDRQGRERGRLTGPAEWDSAEAIAQFQTIIAERNR